MQQDAQQAHAEEADAAQAPEAEIEVLDRYVTDITRTLDEGQPFFPPTDTVVVPTGRGLEVRGGFSATSMDMLTDEAPPDIPEEATLRGDEAIADDVRRELSEDAMTAHLDIDLAVIDGVVTLRRSRTLWMLTLSKRWLHVCRGSSTCASTLPLKGFSPAHVHPNSKSRIGPLLRRVA